MYRAVHYRAEVSSSAPCAPRASGDAGLGPQASENPRQLEGQRANRRLHSRGRVESRPQQHEQSLLLLGELLLGQQRADTSVLAQPVAQKLAKPLAHLLLAMQEQHDAHVLRVRPSTDSRRRDTRKFDECSSLSADGARSAPPPTHGASAGADRGALPQRRARRLPAMALIHTCYRITDVERSVAFYNALGFQEIGRIPIKDEAINVFMNQPGDGDMPRLELTYNFGVDSYELGTGYGHIAITSDDLDATLARLAEQGIEPEKPPYSVREGGSRLCFVRDPDGYRVEIIEKP